MHLSKISTSTLFPEILKYLSLMVGYILMMYQVILSKQNELLIPVLKSHIRLQL